MFELHDWQRDHLIPILEQCAHKKGVRVAIHKPPQYGGSVIVSNRFPAWLLGMDPYHRIALACYNVSHAAAFGEAVRDQLKMGEFKEMFSPQSHLEREDVGAEAFRTKARSALGESQYSFRSIGLLSGFTGHGADTLIIDDPYASADDARSETINEKVWRWWTQTANVRISDDTNVIVMFHRYHEDDFAGRILATGKFQYFRFPAIADGVDDGSDPTFRQEGELLSPMRPIEYLRAIEAEDPTTFLGQFQGRPRPPEGAFFQREWLKDDAHCPPILRWVRFWDMATKKDQKADFTVGALVGIAADHTIWLKDIVRFRAEWPDACEIICRVTEEDKAWADCGGGFFTSGGPFDAEIPRLQYHVGVEKVPAQRPMIQDLFRNAIFEKVSLWPIKPNGDKKERASGWAARAKYDMFRMVKGKWNQEFISEAMAFDGYGLSHDDQIDAVSGAYELLWAISDGAPAIEKPVAPHSVEYYRRIRDEYRKSRETDERDGWDDEQIPDFV